jgi:hypothetical protein
VVAGRGHHGYAHRRQIMDDSGQRSGELGILRGLRVVPEGQADHVERLAAGAVLPVPDSVGEHEEREPEVVLVHDPVGAHHPDGLDGRLGRQLPGQSRHECEMSHGRLQLADQ